MRWTNLQKIVFIIQKFHKISFIIHLYSFKLSFVTIRVKFYLLEIIGLDY